MKVTLHHLAQMLLLFFSQLNLRWELPSQQKPLVSIFHGIAKLLLFLEGSCCPLAFWAALLVQLAPACTGCMFQSAAGLPALEWLPFLWGCMEVSFCLSWCARFCAVSSAWHGRTDLKAANNISYWNEVWKKSDWREPFIFACCFFLCVCFWMAHPSHVGNENIMEWQISNL